jgi:membrane-associated phospholipid phosphatase
MARPTPRSLLLAAGACAVAFAALLALAYGGGRAQGLDRTALQGFIGLEDVMRDSVAALGGPGPVGVMAVGLAVYALARGRPRSAAFVIILLALTSVSSQVLKALLAYDRPEAGAGISYVNAEAFPSGHATASMSLAIALLIVVPARLRPLAAVVGAGFSLAVSFSIVAFGWHFPSDVAGGYLLASFWALVLLAGLRAADERYPERSGRGRLEVVRRGAADRVAALGLGVAAAAGAAVLALAGAGAVVLRGGELVGYLQTHTAVLAVGGALTVAAVGLLAALALASARTR